MGPPRGKIMAPSLHTRIHNLNTVDILNIGTMNQNPPDLLPSSTKPLESSARASSNEPIIRAQKQDHVNQWKWE